MATATISIEVDAETSRLYSSSSAEERHKLQLLLGLRLRELTSSALPALPRIMDEMGHNAAVQGLTPEILESLLNEPNS